MNRSQLADSETCLGCGNCCRSFRLWFDRKEGVAQRFALMAESTFTEVAQTGFPDSMLVEIKSPCARLCADGRCGIFDSAERPSLCSDFPDNLFNRNSEGELVLDDDHADRMIELYSDYCPAVSRIGRATPLPF